MSSSSLSISWRHWSQLIIQKLLQVSYSLVKLLHLNLNCRASNFSLRLNLNLKLLLESRYISLSLPPFLRTSLSAHRKPLLLLNKNIKLLSNLFLKPLQRTSHFITTRTNRQYLLIQLPFSNFYKIRQSLLRIIKILLYLLHLQFNPQFNFLFFFRFDLYLTFNIV